MADQVPRGRSSTSGSSGSSRSSSGSRAERNADARRRRRGGARRGPSPHRRDRSCAAAPRRNTTVNSHGRAPQPGELVRRRARVETRDLDDRCAAQQPTRAVAADEGPRSPARPGRSARTSRCGCSRDGHERLRRRQAPEHLDGRASATCSRICSGHYPAFPGGIGGVEYPEVDVVVHLAAHAKVHQLVRAAAPRARERDDDLQRARVLPAARSCRSSSRRRREVYGDVHRFEDYGEETADFAYTESTYSASKIARRGVHLLVRALLRAAVPRLPLLERLRALRQRPAPHGRACCRCSSTR